MTGSQLRWHRKRLGLTQGALAKLIGMTNVSVCRYETDVQPVPERVERTVRLLSQVRKYENRAKKGK